MNRPQPDNLDVDARAEDDMLGGAGDRQTVGRQQRLVECFQPSADQWIGAMPHASLEQTPPAADVVKNITLDEKLIERRGLSRMRLGCDLGGDFRRHFGAGVRLEPAASCIARLVGLPVDPHPRPTVVELPTPTGDQHGRQPRRFETEEPDARLARAAANVGADVGLGKPA